MTMEKNCIDCDVSTCIYNNLGKECTLKNVRITQDFTELTCCGSYKIQRLRRVTGYLTGDYLSAFNEGKQEEVEKRVKHC